ncbi:MAG: L,D-transpeptidase family protein [Planctomycetaceae bacterium]
MTQTKARPASRSAVEEPKPLAEIDALIADNEYVTAQRELSHWWFQRPESRQKIQARLNKLSQALYFASTPHFFEPYIVQPGDQLRQVGKKFQLSWEYLAKLNRTQPSRIRAGQKLKVVPGPFGVVASLSRFELTLHLSGSYVKHYRIGVGKDGSSPVGTFTVKNKQVDPTYYGPDGVVSNDDPENPLGERWIDIGNSFGIHGTNEPDSIGKAESRGCLRLRHDDVVELYDFLVIGSEVRIEE